MKDLIVNSLFVNSCKDCAYMYNNSSYDKCSNKQIQAKYYPFETIYCEDVRKRIGRNGDGSYIACPEHKPIETKKKPWYKFW